MSRDDPIKSEKDFTSILDEQFPIISQLSDYKEALDKYLVLEKQTRQSSDLVSSKRVLSEIVKCLYENRDWQYLNDSVVSLSKKHGQMKTAIQSFIREVIDKLDQLNDNDPEQLQWKKTIIETIRTVTDKKIFVEVERAKASRILSDIYLERDHDLDKAIEVLCELQVASYSLMDFPTKVEYILKQIELTLDKGDFAQAKILSRNILIKTLKSFPKADEYKATYLNYLIKISTHECDYIEIVKNALFLIDIPIITPEELKLAAVNIVYYIILAPYDNYQKDLIEKIKINPVISKSVDSKLFKLLTIFTTNELIHWSDLELQYKADYFDKCPIFQDEQNYKNLQKRIIEYNLRIFNEYYQCITLSRLAALLQSTELEAETYVSELVNKGMIYAKINRPKRIVIFSQDEKKRTGADINDLLNDWCYDIDKLLDEVDSIGHLINKEEMMYGIKQKA
ncbi:uncharacterized protein KQ657_004043 [Scheffersomyces spartinae]|uniref:PCI domain-containing protein n=1 Tax=Scheffersomyces spartinae TaxID=45513 RepID=A0A9P7VCS0_9ASCO|nr:uncharacterized protein KQ657_004043 [Scheffersomyces spartinae]KAG7194934.1 hypothetical protein KQ657_004043 [Scheffersomyces spartinae]